MTTLSDLNSFGEQIERLLQLRTMPIAIRLLEAEDEIPDGTIRPTEEYGVHLALCQAFAMSRREGIQVAMLKGDHWCFAPVVAFGLAEPPETYLQGQTAYPMSVADLETAKRLALMSPRLEYGKYVGVVSAPLRTANFEPDLVIIYCFSAQLTCLLLGMKYKRGYQVTSTLEPGGVCIQSTVPVILSGECQVAVPCMGDRNRALAQDDELVFSVPKGMLEDLVLGLRHFDEIGLGYPAIIPTMRPEYPLPDDDITLGRTLGMEVSP